MPEVRLCGGLRDAADGAESIQVDGTTIRELLENLGKEYPLIREKIGHGIAISLDGVIYRDDWDQPIPDGAEVGLLVRIAGG